MIANVAVSQDLPLSYKFAYVISGVEAQMTSELLQVPTFVQPGLPKGEPGTNRILLVVYVRDALGCEVRSTLGIDGQPLYITSAPLVVQNITTFMSDSATSLLSDNLQQGKVSTVLSNVGILSQILSDSSNPCANVYCGPFGSCFSGVCTCSQGYAGTLCDVPPVSEWSEWSAVGGCTRSCGTGDQTFTRKCLTSLNTVSTACAGSGIRTDPCNTQECEGAAVDGGFSEWSEWSTCTATCPGNAGGVYTGSQGRSRLCDNPTPSGTGAQCVGDSTASRTHHTVPNNVNRSVKSLRVCFVDLFAEACTIQCVAWAKRCAGSSPTYDTSTDLKLPTVECSGHGTCGRFPTAGCRQDDPACTATCDCVSGWGGSDCSKSSAALAEAQSLRSSFLDTLVCHAVAV